MERSQNDSVISTIVSSLGVASLVLAVAGNNLEHLSELRRWGLAIASSVMLWALLASMYGASAGEVLWACAKVPSTVSVYPKLDPFSATQPSPSAQSFLQLKAC